MKTAISLPDTLYHRAELTAQNLGIPRSQLFARALEEFIKNHDRENITEKLNAVYGGIDPKEDAVHIEAIRNLTQDDAW